MPTYAIGDVHGCYDTLRGLLADCGFDADRDRLWMVGDLVNRGPRSLQVLRWARETQERMGERMVAVLGNHDLHLVARHEGLRSHRKDTFGDVLAAPEAGELIAWLRRRPLLHRQGDLFVVHAGLLPSWTPEEAECRAREIEEHLLSAEGLAELTVRFTPADADAGAPAAGRLRTALMALTRLRTCTAEGLPCDWSGPLDGAPAGCFPWFRVPGRASRGVRVICGHWAALGLHREAGVVALDSGAVYGGSISALRLEDGKIFQQPATENAIPIT